MATLNIINNFSIEVNGVEFSGKQGPAADDFNEEYGKTVDGYVQPQIGNLATGAVRTLWDEDDDNPTGFDFLYFWADQDCYLQLIGQTSNTQILVKAKEPFTLSSDQIICAANTTVMSAGVTPSVEAIDSVVVSNVSGSAANYTFYVID